MSISMPKVSHVHKCPTGSHEWEHKTYSCEAEEEMVCPEHGQASGTSKSGS